MGICCWLLIVGHWSFWNTGIPLIANDPLPYLSWACRCSKLRKLSDFVTQRVSFVAHETQPSTRMAERLLLLKSSEYLLDFFGPIVAWRCKTMRELQERLQFG